MYYVEEIILNDISATFKNLYHRCKIKSTHTKFNFVKKILVMIIS